LKKLENISKDATSKYRKVRAIAGSLVEACLRPDACGQHLRQCTATTVARKFVLFQFAFQKMPHIFQQNGIIYYARKLQQNPLQEIIPPPPPSCQRSTFFPQNALFFPKKCRIITNKMVYFFPEKWHNLSRKMIYFSPKNG